MYMKKILWCVLLGFMSAGYVASSWAAGPGWTAASTVTKVVVTFGGGVNVRLSPDISGCTSQSGYGANYASIYPDHPGIDRIYSGLLAAQMSGKVVALYLVDNTCKVGEILLGGW